MFEIIEKDTSRPSNSPGGGTYWEHFDLLRLYLGDFLANPRVTTGGLAGYAINGRVVSRGVGPEGTPAGWLQPELLWEWERLQERLHHAAQAIDALTGGETAGDGAMQAELLALLRGLTLSLKQEHLVCTDQGRFVLLGWGTDSGTKVFAHPAALAEFLSKFAQVHALPSPSPASRWQRQGPVTVAPARVALVKPVEPTRSDKPPATPPVAVETRRRGPRPWVWPTITGLTGVCCLAAGWYLGILFPGASPRPDASDAARAPDTTTAAVVPEADRRTDFSSGRVLPYYVAYGFKRVDGATEDARIQALLMVELNEMQRRELQQRYRFRTSLSDYQPRGPAYLAFDLTDQDVSQGWGYHLRPGEVRLIER